MTEDISQLSFEAAYDRLQAVVVALENGDLSVEQAVEHYELGRHLAAHCQAILDKADLRVSQIDDDSLT